MDERQKLYNEQFKVKRLDVVAALTEDYSLKDTGTMSFYTVNCYVAGAFVHIMCHYVNFYTAFRGLKAKTWQNLVLSTYEDHFHHILLPSSHSPMKDISSCLRSKRERP